jgi:hypothetical protein
VNDPANSAIGLHGAAAAAILSSRSSAFQSLRDRFRYALQSLPQSLCRHCESAELALRNRFANVTLLVLTPFSIAKEKTNERLIILSIQNCCAVADRASPQSLRNCCAIAVQSLYNRFATAPQSLCNCSTIALQLLHNRCGNCCAIALQLLHNRCGTAAQSLRKLLRNRFATAPQSLRKLLRNRCGSAAPLLYNRCTIARRSLKYHRSAHSKKQKLADCTFDGFAHAPLIHIAVYRS